jgi:hypothetical protein
MQGMEVGEIRLRVDANPRRQMREFVQQVQAETRVTTLFVTHDQSDALMLSHGVSRIGSPGPRQSRRFRHFFAEWHRFAPIFPTADASLTFGMRRENSSVKRAKVSRAWAAPTGCFRRHGRLLPLLSQERAMPAKTALLLSSCHKPS